VFKFILFCAFLVRSGASEFIIDLARCVAGRFVGGPGLVAVLGSGLMGSISGSAVANTVSTGVLTIPLMKRAGFDARFAAGISILSVVVVSWPSPYRMGRRAIIEALALGARNMTGIAVLLVAVGLIVDVIGTTGIGNPLSLMVNDWAHGSLIVTIVLVALASLVLGMGLPVTAAYIVLGTLSAPAI